MSKTQGQRKDGWTKEQDEIVRQEYQTLGCQKVARRLGRTAMAVRCRANFLKVKSSRGAKWTDETISVLKERYVKDGPQVLAEEFEMTAWAVVAKARRLRLGSTRKRPPLRFKWTEEMLNKIRERYVKEGGDELAKEFGTTLTTVQRVASRLGLHTIAGHIRAGAEKAEKNNSCNIRYFDSWSPSMAYILGFFFADGCVNKKRTAVTVCLASRDESVLHYIKKELESRQRIYHTKAQIHPKTGNACQPQRILSLNSTLLVQSLIRLGMHPRKTYRDDPFPSIPDEMIPHFVRGVLDGDGSICIGETGTCAVNFVGSVRFITGVRDSLVRLAGMQTHPVLLKQGKTVEYATVAWSAVEDLRAFLKFIYPDDCGFFLDRKYRKLTEYLSIPRFPRQSWTEFEEECVRRFFYAMMPKELAALLNKSVEALKAKAKNLGVRRQSETDQE